MKNIAEMYINLKKDYENESLPEVLQILTNSLKDHLPAIKLPKKSCFIYRDWNCNEYCLCKYDTYEKTQKKMLIDAEIKDVLIIILCNFEEYNQQLSKIKNFAEQHNDKENEIRHSIAHNDMNLNSIIFRYNYCKIYIISNVGCVAKELGTFIDYENLDEQDAKRPERYNAIKAYIKTEIENFKNIITKKR